MTRAKQNLTIHINSGILDHISTDNLEQIENTAMHSLPTELAMHLTHKDVVLDYFIDKQYLISQLRSGDTLTFSGGQYFNFKSRSILKFSNKFSAHITDLKEKGYELKSVRVNFVVHWKKGEMDKEIKIILPELYFERKESAV